MHYTVDHVHAILNLAYVQYNYDVKDSGLVRLGIMYVIIILWVTIWIRLIATRYHGPKVSNVASSRVVIQHCWMPHKYGNFYSIAEITCLDIYDEIFTCGSLSAKLTCSAG